MKVAFRVDAGSEMGGGHLFRCMSIASELMRRGVENCYFVMRYHHKQFVLDVEAAGYHVVVIPLEFEPDYYSGDYTQWIGGTVKTDVDVTVTELQNLGFSDKDWLVVDHYGLDETFENPIKSLGVQVAIIDDLVNRRHQCNLLIDQTCGRETHEYRALVNEEALVCAGQQYCILRPEFLSWRDTSLERRESFSSIKNIIVNFGSTDPLNITSSVMNDIEDYCIDLDVSVNVVLSSSAPHLREVEKQLSLSKIRDVALHIDATNVAELMAKADIAIGAAGSTTWERCALGLPTLLVKTAENQTDVIEKVVSLGAAVFHDLKAPDQVAEFNRGFSKLTREYQQLSRRSSTLVDGRGLQRVVDALFQGTVN